MENKKSSGRTILAHVVLIILAFLCLFFFYILIVNATRSHAQLQLGFSALPGSSLLTNFKSVINDPAIPILKGIQNSLIVSGCCAAIVTYFSALTAYGIYAYDFKLKRAIAVQAIFTFVGSWNNYFIPALVITSKSKQTLPIMIATLRGADYMNFDMGKIYMMITIAIVPIIVIYLLLSKFIVEGVTLGGVKE